MANETLRACAARWIASGPQGIHQRTAANYTRSLAQHVLPVLGDRDVAALTWQDVRGLWKQMLAAGKGTSVVRNAQIALASCLNLPLEEGAVAQNVARGTLRRLVRSRVLAGVERALSSTEVTRFLAACPFVAPHMTDLFWTLVYAGCAIGEGLGLRPDDVDGSGHRLRIARQWIDGEKDLPKGGRVRVIDIPVALSTRLTARVQALPGYAWLFPGPDGQAPWAPSSVRYQMRAVLVAAELPAHYSPHWFRHAYACRLLEETGDLVYVQRQLGHRSIAVTADLYGAGARPRHRGALDHLHRPPTPPLAGDDDGARSPDRRT